MSTDELSAGTDISKGTAVLGIRKTDKNFDGKLDKKEFTVLMNARERRRKMI